MILPCQVAPSIFRPPRFPAMMSKSVPPLSYKRSFVRLSEFGSRSILVVSLRISNV